LVEFEDEREPVEVAASELGIMLRELAVAVLLARHGWDDEDAAAIAKAPTAGLEILPPELGQRVRRWFGGDAEASVHEDAAPPRPTAPEGSVSGAVDRYNAEHARSFATPDRRCPVCGHKGCFGQLAENKARWACFSTAHDETSVGLEGTDCWHGDQLDLDAHAAGLSRVQLLRREGYLGARDAVAEGAAPRTSPVVLGMASAPEALPIPPGGTSPTPLAATAVPAGKPVIVIDTDEHRVIDEAVAALRDDDRVYQRGGALFHVVVELDPPKGSVIPPGAPRIAALPLAGLRDQLTRRADWRERRMTAKGKLKRVPCHPPGWVAPAVAARGQWKGIRALHAVVESPVLRPDGTVLEIPGYDAATGLLFEPNAAYLPVLENPTLVDAKAALQELREVVEDFPFEADAHEAAWVAALLSAFGRFALDGPCPLMLVDANSRASGKSLLCDSIAEIAVGHQMALMPLADTDEEMRKQITTHAIAGSRLLLIDNIPNGVPLGSASLDRMLTRTRWSDRLLSTSTVVDVPLFSIVFGNGNNVALGADTGRRTLHIRLETKEERPEQRTGFKHPELLAWIKQERPRLVRACLTILRAYCAAGRPQASLPSWGSFEAWSALVRQAVVWVGLRDPADTREELLENADMEASALRDLLEGLEEFGAGPMTASQLLTKLVGAHQEPRDSGRLADGMRIGRELAGAVVHG
jgi:hypothetical protein